MTSKYCRAYVDGKILYDTIEVGWNERTPNFIAAKFRVKVGQRPMTIFVIDRRLALEVFAWKKAADQLELNPHVNVSVIASIFPSGEGGLLFADEIVWGTPHRELRVLAERLCESMISGKFKDYNDLGIIKIHTRKEDQEM